MPFCLWTSACWALDLNFGDSTPGLGRLVVSLDKKLCSTLSLSTQVYKWLPETKCSGNLAMD